MPYTHIFTLTNHSVAVCFSKAKIQVTVLKELWATNINTTGNLWFDYTDEIRNLFKASSIYKRIILQFLKLI